MSLKQEIYDLTYVWCVEANYETDKFIDELYQLFEKRIDSIYHKDIHSVIFYQKIKEMLK